MFIERSSSQVIAANLVAGDFRSNFGGHWNNDRAWVGAYFTGPATGTIHGVTNGVAQEIGATQRATYQLLQDDAILVACRRRRVRASDQAETTGGVRVVTNFSDRPELRIDPTSIINTGTLGSVTNPVTGASVVGGEFAGGFGPLFGQAEYFHYNVNRQGLPIRQLRRRLCRRRATRSPASIVSTIRAAAPIAVSRPLIPSTSRISAEGAWGALELGARYSIIDLNSNYTSGNVTSASSNAVAGGKQQVFTIGANWYVNNNIRFMLDYLHGTI